MARFKMIFSYDGTNFNGFQRQVEGRTVQGIVEEVLERINKGNVEMHASGRTDAGVHAKNQVAHFDSLVIMTADAYKRAFNSLLPDDIHVNKVEEVSSDFHSRYNVKMKEYEYYINIGEYIPFDRNYIYQYNRPLDLVSMQRAIGHLIGEHDFSSFCSYKEGEKENRIRNLMEAHIEKDGFTLKIKLVGNGFLRYMVRNIVGTLIEIGEGKRKADDMIKILNAKNREAAGTIAPACGLYLKHVIY